ncbi:MAG: tRNA (adenosine(37)-N6)-threonylcarbamoyltransferase complex ATPase subunit type 1 TsaE [Ignavibacteria bacterium]|nr:tRNA (adenosine(37)-N6)-threonylcarbamoyltransferase complex ATPase subunit type 1 TsaE [Ignavibacteria bacterium]
MIVHLTQSRDETVTLGKLFGAILRAGDVVALTGTLGSGKTSFITGACAGVGVAAHPSSPTFTLIHEYPAPFGIVAHIDLYRIGSPAELDQLGIEEYFNGQTICFIEWAEMIIDRVPEQYYAVCMNHGSGEDQRSIAISRVHGGAR